MVHVRSVAVAAALLLAGCSDEGPVSGPGTMTATLSGPNGAEGAAVVALLGDGIGEVTALGTTEVHSRTDGDRVQVVLVDQAGGELAFRVAVADTTDPPSWVVEEVAGPDDELRLRVEGYALSFVSGPGDEP